jgi:hypothetical protein
MTLKGNAVLDKDTNVAGTWGKINKILFYGPVKHGRGLLDRRCGACFVCVFQTAAGTVHAACSGAGLTA